MTDRPKAYSYIRFSTPEQAMGDSKRRQVEKAEQYALANNLELVDERFMDLGVSAYRGRNKDDGALADFQQAVADGVIEKGAYLLVESMDRISREKPRKAVRLLESICDSGIVVVTVSDGKVYDSATLDNDPFAFIYAFMVAIRANEESAIKSRRLREVWKRKKELATANKLPMTRRLPAWLSLLPDRSGFEVIEDRASIVRRIFDEAEQGAGQHSIANRLNTDAVETFGDGTRKATFWHRSYVAKILKNPAVFGTFTPHETRDVDGKKVRDPLPPIPDYYPAIVSEEQFDRVNGRRGRQAPPMRIKKGEVSNILAGLAVCPLCESTMTRVNKGHRNGKHYLVCTRAKSGAGCKYHQVKLDHVHHGIIHAATRQLVHDVPSADDSLDDQRTAARDVWEDLSSKIENILVEIERGAATPALRRRLSTLEAELAEAEHEIMRVDERIQQSSGVRLASVVSALERTFADPEASITAMNTALRDAFARCVVDYQEGVLEFYWRHSETPTDVHYTLGDNHVAKKSASPKAV